VATIGIGRKSWIAVLGAVLLAASHGALAQRPSHDEERARDSDICGYRLMTERERSQYRERLQALETETERERMRSDHRAQMQARARERGVVLSCDNERRAKPVGHAGHELLLACETSTAGIFESNDETGTDPASARIRSAAMGPDAGRAGR
jgi:hypothetical protein